MLLTTTLKKTCLMYVFGKKKSKSNNEFLVMGKKSVFSARSMGQMITYR